MTGPSGHGVVGEALLGSTARALDHRLARSQAECRIPSLVGGVVHEGALAWTGTAGNIEGESPTRETQYRIGSITKTFTATLLADMAREGIVALDDPVQRHLPDGVRRNGPPKIVQYKLVPREGASP